ncbi:MAG: hypothetical protein L3K02_08150 [Thermoplasmata archaeon]|nr:hypothetical protein [Thermoplasmata archaeon]
MNREAWREMLRGLSAEEFRVLREVVGDEARAREAQHLATIRMGDWVEFEGRNGIRHRGTVTRINARTISVHCEPGERGEASTHWRVAATFVRRIVPIEVAREAIPDPEAENLSGQEERENPG